MFKTELINNFETLQTPFYYYDLDLLDRTLDQIKEHGLSKGHYVHYAIKANFNFKILEKIRKAGLGIDCVSGGEIERAIESGFNPDQIAFAGVGNALASENLFVANRWCVLGGYRFAVYIRCERAGIGRKPFTLVEFGRPVRPRTPPMVTGSLSCYDLYYHPVRLGVKRTGMHHLSGGTKERARRTL
jgi:hypothetical protein